MTVHLISHTHWDREWYLPYEQFRLRLVGLIDRLLDLLESRPDFRFFHLDGQTIVLEDYLELRPQQADRLRRLIADGRILIGPWYDMPDEFLVSGEALVRNLARGHRLARAFGTPMPVGYLPDLFGHVAQMPQILRHFGLDNAILWRGFGGPKAEYWWKAPDGSRVLMLHLPREGYCNATRVHLKPDAMIERTTRAIEAESARTAVGEVLLMNGVDHVEPHPVIPELARQMSERLSIEVRHSTLPAYVDAVRAAVASTGPSLEVVHGELRGGEEYANLLPGVMSARVYLKQANARVQTLLERRAEPLATFAWMLGAGYPVNELDYAWKTLLQNHPHDSICGCSVDAVHAENMTRFARAEQVARAVADEAAAVIARTVPGAPEGSLRVVAINTTGVPFSGAFEATVDLPYAGAEPRRPDPDALDAPVVLWPAEATVASVRAHDGSDIPFQLLDRQHVVTWVMSRHETPWGLHANRVTLLLSGSVPACGYATFDMRIANGAAETATTTPPALVRAHDRTAENGHLRISINDDGTVDVLDRATGTRYPRCGEMEDVVDAGDEYNYSPPASDRRITSLDALDVRVTRLHSGPVRAAFRVDYALPLPVSLDAGRAGRASETVLNPVSVVVTLDGDSRRVAWRVRVENRSRDHRLRILFPVGAAAIADVRAETAFAVATRPARRDVPERSPMEVPVSYGPTSGFTEAGSDACGAIVFGEGLAEYEAYTDGAPRLALTLLRSVEYLSRDDLTMRPSGHAGPGLRTPEAQCLGAHEFRLAFEPRGERPAASSLFSRAASFVAPPHVVPALGPGGSPARAGEFVTLQAQEGGAVLSACHKAQDSDAVLLRFFNPDACPATIQLGTVRSVRTAECVDFLEQPLGELRVRSGTVNLAIVPHGIATILLS